MQKSRVAKNLNIGINGIDSARMVGDSLVLIAVDSSYITSKTIMDVSNFISTILSIKDSSLKKLEILRRNIWLIDIYKNRRNDLGWDGKELEGYFYFKMGDIQSSIKIYEDLISFIAYDNTRSTSYLNVGELYLLNLDFRKADSMFNFIKRNVYKDSLGTDDAETVLLCKFYLLELGIIEGKEVRNDSLSLREYISRRNLNKLLINWTFADFFNWLKSQKFDIDKKGAF